MSLSKTQIDKLGDRLRDGPATEADLRLLDELRDTFADASDEMMGRLHRRGLQPTARLAKTTASIIHKLRRESRLRLSQVQDIAGCRIVVHNSLDQDALLRVLREEFPEAREYDRRAKPSHGYRAFHLVPTVQGRFVEIQVRTALQHAWAETCERIAAELGIEYKYGGGHPEIKRVLDELCLSVACFEMGEHLLEMERKGVVTSSDPNDGSFSAENIEAIRKDLTAKIGQVAERAVKEKFRWSSSSSSTEKLDE